MNAGTDDSGDHISAWALVGAGHRFFLVFHASCPHQAACVPGSRPPSARRSYHQVIDLPILLLWNNCSKIHYHCAFWDRQLIKRSWVNTGVSDFRVNQEIWMMRLASQISSPFLGSLLAIFSVQFQKQIVSLMNGVFISSGKSLILAMRRWFVSMGGELVPILYYFSFSWI